MTVLEKMVVRRGVNPNPIPKLEPNSEDVAERGVATRGGHSSGNLCVSEEYV